MPQSNGISQTDIDDPFLDFFGDSAQGGADDDSMDVDDGMGLDFFYDLYPKSTRSQPGCEQHSALRASEPTSASSLVVHSTMDALDPFNMASEPPSQSLSGVVEPTTCERKLEERNAHPDAVSKSHMHSGAGPFQQAGEPAASGPQANPEPSLSRPVPHGTTSVYRGVSWHRRSKQWRATIFSNRKPRHLGYFADEKECAQAYDMALVQLRTAQGAEKLVNFPENLQMYADRIAAGYRPLSFDNANKGKPKPTSADMAPLQTRSRRAAALAAEDTPTSAAAPQARGAPSSPPTAQPEQPHAPPPHQGPQQQDWVNPMDTNGAASRMAMLLSTTRRPAAPDPRAPTPPPEKLRAGRDSYSLVASLRSRISHGMPNEPARARPMQHSDPLWRRPPPAQQHRSLEFDRLHSSGEPRGAAWTSLSATVAELPYMRDARLNSEALAHALHSLERSAGHAARLPYHAIQHPRSNPELSQGQPAALHEFPTEWELRSQFPRQCLLQPDDFQQLRDLMASDPGPEDSLMHAFD